MATGHPLVEEEPVLVVPGIFDGQAATVTGRAWFAVAVPVLPSPPV